MAATDIPQRLPTRALRLETRDPDALAAVQPERARTYHQIAPGAFQGSVIEQSFGSAGLLWEQWSCGMRVRCNRPGGYTGFAVPTGARAIWCGAALAPGTLLRVDGAWEMTSFGPLELVCFAVDGAALETVAAQLAGGEPPPARAGNAALRGAHVGWLRHRLLRLLRVVESAASDPATVGAASAHLLHLAAALERAGDARPERLPTPSRRRAAVARVEEYLEARRGERIAIPTLCGVAGVSERTLEYAFREQLGMTLVRYLKVRRLNQVQRALREAEPGSTNVTQVALQWGFLDLGRFAGEYRALFGELPSQTLRCAGEPARRLQCDGPRGRHG
jgi:AraC family ethanolamine operon transcriptional activator